MARNKFDVDETLETPFNIKHLLRAGVYIGRHKKKMILSLLFSAISAACSLLGPMLIQRAIDVSVPNKDYTELVVLAIIMFREFAVAGVRMIAAESGTVIAANMWGKVKTVLQMVTIIFYYFAMALAPADGVGVISFTTQVLCWAVAAVTALSGCIYLWQNRSCFMQAK